MKNNRNRKTSVKRMSVRAQIIDIGKISCSFYNFDTGRRNRIQSKTNVKGDNVKKGDYVYIKFMRVKNGFTTIFKNIYIKQSKHPFNKKKRNINKKSKNSQLDNTKKNEKKVVIIRRKNKTS